MNAKSICICISISLFTAVVSQNCVFGQSQALDPEHAAKIERLAKEYKSLAREDWKKRRDFCIRLMDEGVSLTKTADVVRIFEPDLHYHKRTSEWREGGSVWFERPENLNPLVQNPIGWRFDFECSDNGYLDKYWITNCDAK